MPLVSLVVLCYQHESFVEFAVNAALQQDYPNLQIIISDDASTDGTVAKIDAVLALHSDIKNVVFNKFKINNGIARHFNYLMKHCVQGELVVMSAGDDICFHDRVSKIARFWIENNRPDLISHQLMEIDEQGHTIEAARTIQFRHQPALPDTQNELTLINYLDHSMPVPALGAAVAYSKSLYDCFGEFGYQAPYEDHVMYFRALVTGCIRTLPEVLVKYRVHSHNFSNRSVPRQSIRFILDGKRVEAQSSAIGSLRFLLVRLQQWQDYVAAVESGLVELYLSVVERLWIEIEHYHKKLSECVIANDFLTEDCISLCLNSVKRIPLLLFGSGAGGTFALQNLPAGFSVAGFVDSDPQKFGRELYDLPVFAPEMLNSDQYKDCRIVISSMFYFEIMDLLINKYSVTPSRLFRLPVSYISRELRKEKR